MNATDRARELAVAWEDDSISPEGMSELASLLESDAEARRALVEELMLTAGCAQHAAPDAASAGAPLPRRRWRAGGGATTRKVALVAGLVAAAAVVLVAWAASRPPADGGRAPVARVASVVGGDGSLGVGDAIASGGRVETGGGGAVIRYETDATEVSFGPDTVATIDDDERGKRVRLDAGRLVARVAAQPGGRPMVFWTPVAQCVVLGTVLSIEADADATRLEVTSGRVRIVRSSDGASVDVAAGECARAGRIGPVVKEPARPPEDAKPSGVQAAAPPVFEGHRRILLTEYGAFAQYMLYGSIEGRAVERDGEKVLELTFGAATDDWHGGVWLPARLPQQLAHERCLAVAFRFAGGGTLPRDAFVHVSIRGGGKYCTANVAALFADTSWREIVLRPVDFVRDPYWLSQNPGAVISEQPALDRIERVAITCVSPPMRAAVPTSVGPFRMVIDRKDAP